MARSALIIGRQPEYFWQLPPLLTACGFEVDVLTGHNKFFTANHHLREVFRAEPLFEAALALPDYDWVIPADNSLLHALAHRIDIPEADRMRLAPVTAPTHLGHLNSKIGLSRRLAAAGIPTPDFRVATGIVEAQQRTNELGFPVFAKLDSSAAGHGTVLAQSPQDLERPLFDRRRVLLQAPAEGTEWAVCGLFLQGALVHLMIAKPFDRRQQFGEWAAIRAVPTGQEPELVADVARLGRALGLHGFANITCFRTATSTVFIEADVRPNVWCSRGAEVGDDPIPRISSWWDGAGETELMLGSGKPTDLAYFPRLTAAQMRANWFGVQGQIPRDNPEVGLFSGGGNI